MNNLPSDKVFVKKRKSYGDTYCVYYTSSSVVAKFGGIENVPNYCLGFYITAEIQ